MTPGPFAVGIAVGIELQVEAAGERAEELDVGADRTGDAHEGVSEGHTSVAAVKEMKPVSVIASNRVMLPWMLAEM
jgi:hypothetical protein